MKKWSMLSLAVILMMSMAFVSCKKDKDEEETPVKKNYVTYNNKDYNFTKGYLIYYGDLDAKAGTYNFDVFLCTDGINYNSTTDEFSGSGNIFYMELFSSSATALVPGTYTYDSTMSYLANTYDLGIFAVNFNIATTSGEIEQEIKQGTFKTSNSGSTYTFNIDVMAADGKKITGMYSGALTYSDQSAKKK